MHVVPPAELGFLGAGSGKKSLFSPCPFGKPHLQSRSRVFEPVGGTGLIPTGGSAHAVAALSPGVQTSAAPDPPEARRAASPRAH
jgi:hypothetical protein